MTLPFAVEDSSLGRVVIAENTPPGFLLLYTTADFEGRLTPEAVRAIEAYIAGRAGLATALATCQQVHGDAAAVVPATHGAWREFSDCDALWSATPGVALGIKVADCLPVSILDAEAAVSLNIHAGWRGTVRGIVRKSVDRLRDVTPFQASRAQAWLGPTIRRCCFEVGPEVVDEFSTAFGDVEPYVERVSGRRPRLDVPAITAAILRASGVAESRIFDSGLCTRCEGSMFHSYRRSGAAAGRNLAILAH